MNLYLELQDANKQCPRPPPAALRPLDEGEGQWVIPPRLTCFSVDSPFVRAEASFIRAAAGVEAIRSVWLDNISNRIKDPRKEGQ